VTVRSRLVAYVAVVVFALLVWWVLTATDTVEPILLPSPADTWDALRDLVSDPGLVADTIWSTLQPLLPAFALGAVIGTGAGAVIGRSALLREAYEPLLSNLNTIPVIALYPLLAGAIGVGVLPKLLVGFIAAVLPIAIATVWAVRDIDATMLAAARSMGATPWVRMRSVILPAAMPGVFTGLRTGLGLATVTVIAGEFIASTAGIGHQLAETSQSFQTPQLFAWLVITLAFTAVVSGCMSLVEGLIERRVKR
jgi:NitT/TauT family transport system permease protein